MNTTTAPRTFPAHDLKGGDRIGSREILDVIDTFGPAGRVAILFTDGTRRTIPTWATPVTVA
jgi:hypothetical protein